VTRKFCTIALLLFLCSALYAQTAARLTTLLDTPVINWSEAAIIALEASDKAVFTDPDEAFNFAQKQNWLPKNVEPGDGARLDGVSLLLVKSFDVKGGMFYRVTKSAHHAYRELVYQEVILGDTDPFMEVSGPEFLYMIGRLLDRQEPEDISVIDTEYKEYVEPIIEQHPTFPNIQFEGNSAVLKDSEKEKLREIAELLKSYPEKQILVTGHTAASDDETARMRTSMERAQAVAAYLILLGARTPDEIIIKWYGSNRPLAPNNTLEGMALNRRVEITYIETENN
jgi:outer membrane protein OmpA-like peptidoglycan-associated protein